MSIEKLISDLQDKDASNIFTVKVMSYDGIEGLPDDCKFVSWVEEGDYKGMRAFGCSPHECLSELGECIQFLHKWKQREKN